MNKKGYLIFELNIAVFIAAIVFAVVLSIYISVWQMVANGNEYLSSYAGSRSAAGWMSRDIRCAAQVIKQYPETGTASYSTGDSVIVLKVPSIDSAGEVINSCYDHVVYRLSGSDLYRIVIKNASSSRSNENRIIARNCESLTFRSGDQDLQYYVDNDTLATIDTVSIYLPINKTRGVIVESTNPTTIVRLRNK